MRITNHMIFGNAINNVWRNARHLNNLVQQIETQKKINRPSDDPMIASRSLRFRTILSETEQFLRNIHQGLAWMEVSESALNNLLTGTQANPSLMQRTLNLLLEGADSRNQLDDQLAIIAEMRQHFEQKFRVEMNQTYMGRYVFSGFLTNQPPVLKADVPDSSFIVTQMFNIQDIERTSAFHRPTSTSLPESIYVNILKLPYTNVDFNFDTSGIDPDIDVPTLGIFSPEPQPTGTQFIIIPFDSTDPEAYRPPVPGFNAAGNPIIHHIRDTGELVMGDDVRDIFQNGTRVTYEVRDLRAGELNPVVYFPTIQIQSAWVPDLTVPNPYDPEIPNPAPGEEGHVPGMPPPVQIPNPEYGELGHVPGTPPPAQIPNPDFGEPGHVPGTPPPTYIPNPEHLNWVRPLIYDEVGDVRQFNTEGQDVYLEVSSNSHVKINSHARNILSANMFSDLRRLFDFAESIQLTDPRVIEHYILNQPREYPLTDDALAAAVEEFGIRERQEFRDMLYSRFNNLLQLHERHTVQASREHTYLGSRMSRLDMIEVRLEEDEVGYTALLSATEDTDVSAAIIRKDAGEAAFNAALRAIAMVTQLSLANFINR